MALLLTLALMSAVGSARADIYGYVDTDGAGHFPTEKLDNRHQIFMRSGGNYGRIWLQSRRGLAQERHRSDANQAGGRI